MAHLEVEMSKKEIELEKLQKVESENKTMKNTIMRQKREINKITNKADGLQKTNTTLRKENNDLSERNQELKRELDKGINVGNPEVIVIGDVDTGMDGFQTVQKRRGTQKEKENRGEKNLHKEKRPKGSHSIPVIIGGDTAPSLGGKNCNARPVEMKKTKILVTGDSNVRGLGPMVQSRKVDGLAVVQPGFRIQDLQRHIHGSITDSTDVVFINCGANNLSRGNLIDTVCKLDNLLDSVSQTYENKEFVMLEVPPSHKINTQNMIRDLNDYMHTKCQRYNNVRFMNCGLDQNDLRADGIHLNEIGKTKVAKAIVKYAEARV